MKDDEQDQKDNIHEGKPVQEGFDKDDAEQGPEPKEPTPWKEHLFKTQIEAYEWLQWACPKEYHYKVGLLPDGKRAVLVKTPPE